jgi:hypothetical protein
MTRKSLNLRFPNVRLTSVALIDDVRAVSAEQINNAAVCPRCQIVSSSPETAERETQPIIPLVVCTLV